MPSKRVCGAIMHISGEFKAGDPAPSGYLDWHEWAQVQHKAGLRQVECPRCSKWKYPQELSGLIESFEAKTRGGKVVKLSAAVCIKCVEKTKP